MIHTVGWKPLVETWKDCVRRNINWRRWFGLSAPATPSPRWWSRRGPATSALHTLCWRLQKITRFSMSVHGWLKLYKIGSEIPINKMGDCDHDQVIQTFLWGKILKDVSMNTFLRSQQTPNKSFMKLFGYISGANEVWQLSNYMLNWSNRNPIKDHMFKNILRMRPRFLWPCLLQPKWPLKRRRMRMEAHWWSNFLIHFLESILKVFLGKRWAFMSQPATRSRHQSPKER